MEKLKLIILIAVGVTIALLVTTWALSQLAGNEIVGGETGVYGFSRASNGTVTISSTTASTVFTTTTSNGLNYRRVCSTLSKGFIWCSGNGAITATSTVGGWRLNPISNYGSSTQDNCLEFGVNQIPFTGTLSCMADLDATVITSEQK